MSLPQQIFFYPYQSFFLCAWFDRCRLRKRTDAAVRGGKMARRENCVQCVIATASNQPTAGDYCRQCGRSTDINGVATVDRDVLVSAVTETLYERCNSQFPQGGRTAATATFKNVPIDLVAAFCDAEPGLWRRMDVKSSPSKRRVKYVTTRMEGIASLVCFHEKHGDTPRVVKSKSRTRAMRARARVEQHKRRASFSWVRLTDNGDIVTLLPPFIVEVTETPWKRGSKLRSILGTLRFHTAIVLATVGSKVQLPEGYPLTLDSRSAWPILPHYTDPKAYLMSELQDLCGSSFQHLLGAPGESDGLRSIQSWDCTAPNPPPPYMDVGRSRAKWEGPEGGDAPVHMRRLAHKTEEPREEQGRRELWEEGTESSINTSDFMDDKDGRASSYTSGFTVDTEDVRCGPHLMPEYRRCKAKQRLIAEREAARPSDECVSTRQGPRLAYKTYKDR